MERAKLEPEACDAICEGQSNLFVSVIIPVLNDFDRLEICLSALEKQTYPTDLYEVIVVDNGSTESLEPLTSRFSHLSLTYEAQVGSYAARNTGILMARGQIIAFTDSDCIPAPTWLETGVKQLTEPNYGIVAGRIVAGRIAMFFKECDRPTAVELYDSMTYLQQQRYVEEFRYGATANLFVFREVLEQVGHFNSKLTSGGDLEWGQRASSLGYLITYAEDSCVHHPARHSLTQLYQKVARVSKGHCELDDERNQNNQHLLLRFMKNLFSLRPPLRSAFHKITSDTRLKNNSQKFQIFLVILFVHYVRSLGRIQWQLLQVTGILKR
jgi:glycosyltransferase involved in cell wall biosynthesis